MPAPPVGSILVRPLQLDAAAIKAGACQVGDMNPLHHDEDIAAASRFGELIASGAHTSALLAGILGSGFGNENADDRGWVGVDYHVKFRAPVRVGRKMRMEWVVASLEQRRAGVLAVMEGRIVDAEDETLAVTAEMKILYFG